MIDKLFDRLGRAHCTIPFTIGRNTQIVISLKNRNECSLAMKRMLQPVWGSRRLYLRKFVHIHRISKKFHLTLIILNDFIVKLLLSGAFVDTCVYRKRKAKIVWRLACLGCNWKRFAKWSYFNIVYTIERVLPTTKTTGDTTGTAIAISLDLILFYEHFNILVVENETTVCQNIWH